MRKIIILLLVLLGCCFSAFGVELCQSGGIKTKTSSSSRTEFPGVTFWDVVFNKGHSYESKFYFPCNWSGNDNSDKVSYSVTVNNSEILTYTESEFANENKKISIKRGEIMGYGENSGGHYHSAVQFHKVCLTTSVEWSYDSNTWYCIDDLLVSPNNNSCNKSEWEYNQYYKFDAESYGLISNDLWNRVKENSGALASFNNNGTINIYFRLVYFVELEYRGNRHDGSSGYHTAYIRQPDNKWSYITINRCDAGTIKISDNVPPINGDSLNGYALYQSNNINTEITVSSNVGRYNGLSVGDMRCGKNCVFYRSSDETTLNGEIENKVMFYGDEMTPGEKITLERLVIKDNTQKQNRICKSNTTIDFKVLPEPSLDGIELEKSEIVVCPKTADYSSSDQVSDIEDFIELHGNYCDYNGFEDYKSTYGTVYGWRYWTDRNSAKNELVIKNGNDIIGSDKLFDYNNDDNSPSLHLPIYALDPKRTYYFEQYVKFKNFGSEAAIEATVPENSGFVKYYTVRVSKSLDKDNLNVSVTPNEACFDEELDNVLFTAKYEGEDPKLYGVMDKNGFKYAWKIDDKEGEDYSVDQQRGYGKVQENHCMNVSLSDGCGNKIEKEVCLEVHELPAFSAQNIVNLSSNISFSYETDVVSKEEYVLVQGLKGSQFKFEISDDDKSLHNYYYSASDDGTGLTRFVTYNDPIVSKTFYVYKEPRNGYKCLSKPVKVMVVEREKIEGNQFYDKVIYVCAGTKVPRLDNTNISAPVQKSGMTYKFSWQYSGDNMSWKEMQNTDESGDKHFMDSEYYLGDWTKEIEEGEKLYIRRNVKAYLNGEEIDSNDSESLMVTTFAQPSPTITLTAENSKSVKCYDDIVNLSMSVNQDLIDQQKVMKASHISKYGYYNFDGKNYNEIDEYDINKDHALQVKGNYVIHSGVNYCGNMVYSKTGVAVETYPQMDVTPIVSACKIVGQEVTVKASGEDLECAISGSSVEYPDETDKSVATILLAKKQSYTYFVDIENTKTGCTSKVKKTIQDKDILDKVQPKEIGSNGNKNEKVCADVDVTLFSTSLNDEMKDFQWSVDGVYIKNGNNPSASYKFPEAGTDYKVAREWSYKIGEEKCYSVIDEVTVSTYPKVDVPTLQVSNSKICNGEDIKLTATSEGGGSLTSYSFTLMPGNVVSSDKVSKGKSVDFDVNGLKATTSFYVIAEDNNCPSNDIYKTQSEKVAVEVEKDLAFTITSSKSVITRDEFKDGVISVPVTIEEALPDEILYYTLGDSETETKVVYPATGGLSVKMDETLFEANNNTKMTVRRVGSVLSSCTSSATKIFGVNDGFEGVPALTGNGKDQEIEVCGGTEVELAVSNVSLMTFAGENITKMTDNLWTWFKDNSVVAKTTVAEYTATAAVGKTNVYNVVFSGKDSDGTLRKVSSGEFVVKGSKGIEVGRIEFGGEYSSQNFVEFCNNKESEMKITMTCELDPDVVDFTWKYSPTGAAGTWKDVPETWNGKESTKSGVITVSVDSLVLNGGENFYFQVEAKDNCDNVTVSKSKNMLQVKIKKNIELPVVAMTSPKVYSSSEPLPTTLDFSRKSTHATPYEFVGWGESEDLGGTSQRVSTKALHFGENKVDVLRTELAKISNEECVSDTLHYSFNIYKRLATPVLMRSVETIDCPNNKTPKFMTLNQISGGDESSYNVAWQYKLNEDADWAVMVAGDNQGLFTADFGNVMPNLGSYLQSIEITNQTQSIIVRAWVSCDKDKYPGEYVMSNEVAMEVYAPLRDKGIDLTPQEICYNTAIDTIKGYLAEGGSGRYSYTWWSSEDRKLFEQVVKGEDWEPFFAPRNFGGAYNLTKTTYFKRVVTDTVCKTSLESEVKTIGVRDAFDILSADVDYSRVVTNNDRAEMTGTNDDYDEYIWWQSESKEFKNGRTSAGTPFESDALTVPTDDDFMMVTYYAQAVKDGCRSVNKLPMEIYVYNQTGGSIFFEDEDSKPNGYWICSGESDIQILSDDYARAGSFLWYYKVDGGKPLAIMSEGKAVTTPEINLGATGLYPKVLTNDGNGDAKRVQIYRMTTVKVDDKETKLSSDTLVLNIVPTLESVSDALSGLYGDHGSFAGTIKIENGGITKQYCIGDAPDAVVGNLTNEDNLFSLWSDYKNYIGPWLYDKKHKGGFVTYYEYSKDGGEWIQEESYDFSKQFEYAGMDKYYIPTLTNNMDGSYSVRRVMSDGCSSLASNEVVFTLFDKTVNADTVSSYAFTPEMTNRISEKGAIKEGYEIGDSIVFVCQDREVSNLVWFSDMLCTDTLMNGNRYCSLVLDESVAAMMSTDGAYIYAKAKRGDCLGEAVEIPFAYGTTSEGGRIGILDTIICQNDSYSDILNIKTANGYYIAPENVAMKWSYSWQFKRSTSEKAVWSNIDGATGESLPADIINDLVAKSMSETDPLVVRRVATNEKGRVRYSNVITLVHYDELVPGELSLTSETNKFCTYDELGFVKTTSAKGGRTNGNGRISWKYSVNGKDSYEKNDVDSLYLGYIIDNIEDRSVNNIVNIKCVYYDMCDSVESEGIEVVFNRRNNVPSLYQNNDSCNASLVNLVVYKENVKKIYTWNAIYIDPLDTTYTEKVIWTSVGDSQLVIRNQMPTSLYGIKSVDDETGCISDYFYFNVDSLPELSQAKPDAPSSICAGSDLKIKGGVPLGGNGSKTFQWQISTTGREDDFADIVDATNEDLVLPSKYMKTPSYFRRIIVDMCDTDTSEIVYVGIREKVSVSPEDLVFDDFKCPNGIFTASVVAEKDTLYASEYWTLGGEKIMEGGKKFQLEGFAGDSMAFSFIHYLTDTNGVTCQSEKIVMMAHNKPSISNADNVISTENFTPCNESLVKIKGKKLGGAYSDQIKYTWFVNDIEQIGNFEPDFRFRANDDMLVKRVANNGCVTDTSNVLHLEGQMVFRYDYEKELALEVVSNVADSSVTMNILGSKKFSEGYYFEGDGEMPNVTSNSILFPYKYDAYKDTILEVYANQTYCVTPYAIKPLRGGVISFDGDMYICVSDDIKPIVATELEGASAAVSYQWQYRNDRTPDFINIEGATNKSYTPSAIDLATTYRRIATDGVYKSISNELTMSIRPLPSVAKIAANIPLEDLKEMGLSYSKNEYYQWIPNSDVMAMSLVDSASNADKTYWQKSYDNIAWILESENTDSMLVKDTVSTVYYRFIAESACGADTSSVVRLLAAKIEPITDAQIDWTNTDTFVCRSSEKNYLKFNLHNTNTNRTQGIINKRYLYSYRAESSADVFVWCNRSFLTEDTLVDSPTVRIFELDENGERQMPSDNVTLFVTRHDTVRGLSVTRSIKLKVNTFDASFAMSIENEPEIKVGENKVNEIKQGNRVRFVPVVSSNVANAEVSYKWVLEEPLNMNYVQIYGGRNGLEGLTSERETPACYYYNGGYYPVSLTVSDGFCQKTIRDTSLYISEATRNFTRAMMMEDDLWDYENNELSPLDYSEERHSVELIDVYPTLVSDVVNVNVKDKMSHKLILTDESGRLLYIASFSEYIQISMNDYISGVYLVVVDDWYSFKILKK